jgi:hypothetical protein
VNIIIRLLNGALTWFFDVILWPFRSLGPWWSVVVVSLLTGILMLWLFGKVSNQDAIRIVRDKIRGNLIGIRLFGDDIGLLFRLQGRIFRQTLTYLKYAAIPFVIMLLPVILVLIQLDLRFGYRPLHEGETTVVSVRVSDPALIDDGVTLEVPDGLEIETSGVRIPSLGEVAWRVRAKSAGRHSLTIRAGGESVEKDLVVSDRWDNVSRMRSAGALDALMHPGEQPLSSSGAVASIAVVYPEDLLAFFRWDLYWMIPFFILSIAFGFAFRRPLGIEI